MFKKKITLGIVSSVLMTLFAVSSASAAIPGGSIIIGNKAYDINLLFDPSYVAEVNAALANSGGVMYYNLGGDTFYDIMTNDPVTSEQMSELPQVTYVDSQGQETVYGEGDGDPVSVSEAEVSVVSGAISSFKQITVNSVNIEGAAKFAVKDLSTNTLSAETAIGEAATVMTSQTSLELYIFDASGGEIASGVLVVSSDGAVTVRLTLGDPVSASKAEVSVVSSETMSFKQITVNSVNIEGAVKFAVKDLTTDTMSAETAIGEAATIMTSQTSLKLYILDASGVEIASGVLAVSSDGDVTVQLTPTDESFEVISID